MPEPHGGGRAVRWWAAGLLLSAALPAAALGGLYARQDRLVFRPTPGTRRTPADLSTRYTRVQVTVPSGPLPAWWRAVPESPWAVLYFHGSDGNVDRELPVAGFLASLGVNALLVEYPGYAGDDHRPPTEAGCYQAGEGAWAFVAERGIAAEHVLLYGMSLGTAVATHLAAHWRCGGIVLQNGFTSVPDMAARAYPYLPVRPFCRIHMDNAARIADCDAPVMLIHSRDDEHIPVAHAHRLYQLARQPKRLIVTRGSHFGGSWRHHPEVTDAWRDLLSGRTASWAGAATAAVRHG